MKSLLFSLMILCFVSCNPTKQDIVHAQPNVEVIADETYWESPDNDEFGRSIIYSFNQHYTEQLDDFKGVARIMEEPLDEGVVTWFLITDDTLDAYEIIRIIDERCSNHSCLDTTHVTCDGGCSCDGLGCCR